MNKAELINAMVTESGLSKSDALKALHAFTHVVTSTLKRDEKVILVGFGTFSVGVRASRVGVNPSTGKKIEIPSKRVAKFKAGSDLMAEVE
jgi:DNA-binding protein HU-beta